MNKLSLYIFYYISGLIILILNKIRYKIKGYTTPNTIKSGDIYSKITYDQEVVDRWEKWLIEYTENKTPFDKKNILELGPGNDLGTGVFCIEKGASSYTAYDKNSLATDKNQTIYKSLLKILKNQRTRVALESFIKSEESILKYMTDKTFNFKTLENKYSCIVSQAAFEHFEDIQKTIKNFSEKSVSGAVLCTEIDLQTHSRWIREKDPNNIYRFPAWLFKLLNYTGIPNRIRPEDYKNILEKNGWTKIKIIPLITISENDLKTQLLSKDFKNKNMHILTCAVLATKL